MNAEILSIGTELLLGDIVDTNAQSLAQTLAKFGIAHYRRMTVGDNLERCVEALREALSRADVVFTIGGLGPTADDITREAIAKALGVELVHDENVEKMLREDMERRKRVWLDAHAKMAKRPACCKTLPNEGGPAPGLVCEKDGKWVIALPGPKHEFLSVLGYLEKTWFPEHREGAILSKVVRIAGITEAAVEKRIEDLIDSENPTVAPYVKLGEVHLRITARAKDEEEAEKLIAPIRTALKERFGHYAYGEDEEDLPYVVVNLLKTKRRNLATAESCTGGMLGERITSIPGASDVYVGGVITYSDEAKATHLNVARTDLQKYGAVSEEIARQMSEGVVRNFKTNYGIGITGIAGPGGGTETKPVGLVYVSLTGPRGTEVKEERFLGNRETIRFRATQTALLMLYEELVHS
ncbi:MAG TPA: competence/damage-inducible protein A [Fimbriimonadales bacterium]|nr:competence/damage-inducible protein A [Fimbriimonadales bacterium]